MKVTEIRINTEVRRKRRLGKERNERTEQKNERIELCKNKGDESKKKT